MENKTPFNLEAEQAVLGAIIINQANIDNISELLQPYHFYDGVHGKIYEYMVSQHLDGKVFDGVILLRAFAQDESVRAIGGAQYIGDLINAAIDDSVVIDYAQMIAELAARRGLVMAAQMLIKECESGFDGNSDVEKIVSQHEQVVRDIFGNTKTNTQLSAGSLALQYVKNLRNQEDIGISTGIETLDEVIGTLRAGHLWLVGGRPAMGKSAVALTVAQNIAMTGKGVLFFSMDMAADQVSTRLLSMFCKDRIEYRDITAAKVNDSMQAQLNEAAFALQSLPLEIDDKRGRTVADILAATRRAKAAFEAKGIELGLVIVDHLQKIKAHNQNANDYSRATDNIRSLKDAAMKMGAPVMLCSQLSRGLESRDDKRPRMSDLRDSGAIEEEADVITLLYRDAYYARQMMDAETDGAEWEKLESRFNATRNDLDLISPKVRQGEPKSVKVNIDIGVNRIAVRPRHDRFGVIY